MNHITDCAALQVVNTPKHAYYTMQSNTPFAHVVGNDGAPERVFSETHINVPLHSWSSPQQESEAIIRVMVKNAEEYTFQARSYRAMDRAFWVQLQQNLKAIIVHPSLRDAVFFPEPTQMFYSPLIALDRVICLGPPGRAGTLLVRDDQRGYILPTQSGVMSVRIDKPFG